MLLKDFLGQVLGPEFLPVTGFPNSPAPEVSSFKSRVWKDEASPPHREAVYLFLLSSFIVTGNFLFPSACSVGKEVVSYLFLCDKPSQVSGPKQHLYGSQIWNLGRAQPQYFPQLHKTMVQADAMLEMRIIFFNFISLFLSVLSLCCFLVFL